MTGYSFLYAILLIVIGYLSIRNLYFYQPATLPELVEHGLIEPVQDVMNPILQTLSDIAPNVSGLRDWLPFPRKKYIPNRYGYGGIDPSTGDVRKGGDGMGIPNHVEVGWWNGEIPIIDRSLSPVHDSEEIPSPQVVSVGWWGDSFNL